MSDDIRKVFMSGGPLNGKVVAIKYRDEMIYSYFPYYNPFAAPPTPEEYDHVTRYFEATYKKTGQYVRNIFEIFEFCGVKEKP